MLHESVIGPYTTEPVKARTQASNLPVLSTTRHPEDRGTFDPIVYVDF